MDTRARIKIHKGKEVYRMKKVLVCLLSMAFVLAMGGMVLAAVQGACVNCHTMHSSQTPAPTEWTDKGWTSTTPPAGALVVTGCFGCHSHTGSDSTLTAGNTTLPIVWNKTAPSNPLAGGNFYYRQSAADDKKVHNVLDITGQDSILASYEPPGYKAVGGIGPVGAWGTNQLRCAGAYGCHGNRATAVTDQFAAVRGYHHATGATPYRFLNGIEGKEDDDWEEEVATDHNVYKGDDADNTATISYLCGQCHGNFHKHANLGTTSEVGSASPWLRHPTDIALAASGGSSFTTDYGTSINYNTETPVGFEDPVAVAVPITTFTAANARVLCLSCHRAHGSGNAQGDILRFAYDDSIGAGSHATTGCLRCHQRQR